MPVRGGRDLHGRAGGRGAGESPVVRDRCGGARTRRSAREGGRDATAVRASLRSVRIRRAVRPHERPGREPVVALHLGQPGVFVHGLGRGRLRLLPRPEPLPSDSTSRPTTRTSSGTAPTAASSGRRRARSPAGHGWGSTSPSAGASRSIPARRSASNGRTATSRRSQAARPRLPGARRARRTRRRPDRSSCSTFRSWFTRRPTSSSASVPSSSVTSAAIRGGRTSAPSEPGWERRSSWAATWAGRRRRRWRRKRSRTRLRAGSDRQAR